MQKRHSTVLKALAGLAFGLALLAAPVSAQTYATNIFHLSSVTQLNVTWPAEYEFKQTFVVQAAGFPTEVAVRCGSYASPTTYQLVISSASGQVIARQTYTGMTPSAEGYVTYFPISNPSRALVAGEQVVLALTPTTSIYLTPAYSSFFYYLPDYGKAALSFYVKVR